MLARFLSGAAVLAISATAAQADFTLTILHTNDFHARYEPISSSDSTCSASANTEGSCFGGTARLVNAVADARARAENSILVDGGDQFQGTLFYTYYKGAVAAEFMNQLGYTAMTVGNHEFDDGPEVLRDFVAAVDFPILMSNADISQEPELAGSIQKSTIVEVGGERIGLIGLTPHDTHELASPGPNVIFTDPAESVQEQVDQLTAEGINKIVLLSHSGLNVDMDVAARVTGIDVIVGGHDNSLLSNTIEGAKGPYPVMVGNTAIVQAYAYGKFLGELNVTFNDAGEIVTAVGEPLLINNEVPEDETVVARIAELAIPLDEIRNEIVAQSGGEINGDRNVCRLQECSMGNLVADAQLARVAGQGVTISLANSGGLRASIDAGEVTMGEVLTVLPFQNTLATFTTTGQGIVDALENGASQMEDVAGRFLQVAGLKYTVDPSAPAGSRISDVLVQEADEWVPIDLAATYGAVTNNYVRNGGDGFAAFVTAENAYDFGPDLADVVVEYLVASGPYQPYVDGRITVK
ncbi:bifunctional metallophosphatase/5'-nucleotidase [Ketogulonicigenium vulgare]|uniref:bifunctional metallophosphatase/5'-nucleotidase n=1 Tax=Ketogulonicigenium vulgare TaxID=92945 RepID=UPI00235970EF|nr:bifunctional metallophosphatase/5'-nucleotidase [Ketogulonicigenium vulgare]